MNKRIPAYAAVALFVLIVITYSVQKAMDAGFI